MNEHAKRRGPDSLGVLLQHFGDISVDFRDVVMHMLGDSGGSPGDERDEGPHGG